MKRLIFFLFFLALFGLGLFWWQENFKAVSQADSLKSFVIPKGASASYVGTKLAEAGLIKNALVFKIYTRITGAARKIIPGEYLLSPSYTLIRIVNDLTGGPVEVWVTVPEGLRREEIAQKFIVGLGKKEDLAASFFQEFLAVSQGQEGFLFPDTYLFPKEASASAVFSMLRATFNRKTENLSEDIQKSGHTLSDIVTIASLVERETRTKEERPIVSGILYKRLKSGWPLQIDASVQYALATVRCQAKPDCDWWPDIFVEDKAVNSRYNTYKFAGLPPAPIANPGLSAISAAVFPEDSVYWYYLHDASGQIHFARTLEEHNANIAKYLR